VQGIPPDRITILTPYLGQLSLLRRVVAAAQIQVAGVAYGTLAGAAGHCWLPACCGPLCHAPPEWGYRLPIAPTPYRCC
jgi:hypothetical protein